MNNTSELIIALMAGLGLGVIFFYGLWRTIEKIITLKLSGLWLIVSMISRISIAIVVLYLITIFQTDGQFERLILCLVGFLMSRFLFVKILEVKYAP